MDKIIELITVKNAVKIGAAIGLGYSAYCATKAIGDVIDITAMKASTKALEAYKEVKKTFDEETGKTKGLATKEPNKPFQKNVHCGF